MEGLSDVLETTLRTIKEYVFERDINGKQGSPRILFLGYHSAELELVDAALDRLSLDEIYKERHIIFAKRDLNWSQAFSKDQLDPFATSSLKREDFKDVLMINPGRI